MSEVRALGYVGFETQKLAEWKQFAPEVLGLQIGAESTDGRLVLRADAYQQRIILHPGTRDDVLYAGWEVSDADMLDALRARLQAAGLAVTPGSATEASERAVRDFIRFKDADGNTLEAFYGATVRNDDPFCSPLGRGPFITGEQGLGHIVLQAEDYEAQVRFYTRTLAFKVTDYNDVDIPGLGPNAHLTFLHVNPRHHSLALGNFPIGRRFNHLMLEVSSLDDVGFAYERAKKSGAHILFDLGRHSNDNVFSFYVLTPSGWAVEVGWGGIHVDDATWHVTHHRATSTWGHRFMPPTKA